MCTRHSLKSISTKASYYRSTERPSLAIPSYSKAFSLRQTVATSFLPGSGKRSISSYAQAFQPTPHKNTPRLWKLPTIQSNQLWHLGLSSPLPCADSAQCILLPPPSTSHIPHTEIQLPLSSSFFIFTRNTFFHLGLPFPPTHSPGSSTASGPKWKGQSKRD